MINVKKNLINILLTSGITAFTATATFAQEGPNQDRPFLDRPNQDRPNNERASKQRHGAALFKRLDTNEDLVLELEELLSPALTKAEKRFERKDENGDDFLSIEETIGNRSPRDLSEYADDIVQCVSDLKADTGNENIVVPDAGMFISAEDKFANTDSSGDGLLDLDEVLAKTTRIVTAVFDATDTDGDQIVTPAEFKTHITKKKTTRRAIKTCIDEITDEE